MNSLLDIGGAVQNAIAMGNLMETQRRNDLTQQNVEVDRQRLEFEDRRLRQNSTFKAFDELEKLSRSPQFATPQQQVKLRFQQANLIKMGLGVDMPMPSEEEMLGNHEHFAENLRLYRQGADPATREAALERMVMSMPDYGKHLIDTLKDEGQLDARGEELRMKLELHGPKLAALNQKSGRVALQQGLFSENMGAIAQTVQLTNNPKFQAHFQKLMGMSPMAQQAYLKMNPQFQQEFTQAMQPHLEKIGAVGPEFEQAFGEDVKPRFLGALDQEIEARLQAKNEAIERDGVAPTELGEELSGMELVRKARTVQYAWMRDPFNKEKYKAMQKAQQDIRIAYDATGKTMSGIQSERLAISQAKFDAGQQEKLASDYAQSVFHQKLKEGHDENDAIVLAGKAVAEKYPNTPYNAKDLKTHKPLVENKNDVKIIDKTNQALGTNLADHVAKQIDSSYKAAQNAYDTLDGVERIRTALDSNKVTLGPGATIRNTGNQIMQILGIGGKDTAERLSNTRTVIQDLARFTVKARTQLRGEGQITEGEQKVLAQAESGKIDDFTVPDFRTFLGTVEKISRRTYDRHQKTLEKARGNPAAKDLVPFYEIDPLPPPRAEQAGAASTKKSAGKAQPQSGGAVLKSLPQGSRQIGTSGGKPVFEGPDGKRWIGE